MTLQKFAYHINRRTNGIAALLKIFNDVVVIQSGKNAVFAVLPWDGEAHFPFAGLSNFYVGVKIADNFDNLILKR